ncbi:MAG: hypothetical protein K1X89_07670 [Myxococcaceae bacterium]|nr:hypothetical protein [Myxococcaceae bacterium]
MPLGTGVHLPGFSATVTAAPDGLWTLRLTGLADPQAAGPLAPYLELLDRRLLETSRAVVMVDLRALLLLSAPCFKLLANWLTSVRERSAKPPYEVHFLSNAAHRWQSARLETLRELAPAVVRVDPGPGGNDGGTGA